MTAVQKLILTFFPYDTDVLLQSLLLYLTQIFRPAITSTTGILAKINVALITFCFSASLDALNQTTITFDFTYQFSDNLGKYLTFAISSHPHLLKCSVLCVVLIS